MIAIMILFIIIIKYLWVCFPFVCQVPILEMNIFYMFYQVY